MYHTITRDVRDGAGLKRIPILRLLLLSMAALLLTIVAVRPALAQGQEPITVPGPAGLNVLVEPNQTLGDDGGAWELGTEGSAGNLTAATAAERYGMWYWLNGWFVRRFDYNESLAWETDYKRAALGGNENYYTDAVDLAFYVGHGSPGTFTFDNGAHNDPWLSSSYDCDTSWGDNDNEWLALTSCQVLSGDGVGSMAQCMNRQHLILGFVSNASAHNNWWETQSYNFGRYLRFGYNMTQAWFNACDISQRGRVARVIAEDTACFNDNPYYSSVCADTYDNDYFWYTHNCGTASASVIPLAQLGSELPIFQTQPLSTDEAGAKFERLGGLFDVPTGNVVDTSVMMGAASIHEGPGISPTVPANSPFLVSTNPGSALQMDKSSGLYQYTNLNALWNAQSAQAALSVRAADANYVNEDVARGVADAFLNRNGLMDSGAQFYEVVADTTGNLPRGVASAAVITDVETPTNWQVIYTRVLPTAVVNAAGVSAPITFTVVGPGAKLKVYVPITGASAADVVDGNIFPIGAQGGWRPIQPLVDAASGQAVTTSIVDTTTIEALYLALDAAVTMNTIPLDIKSREILSATIAYWEAAAGSSQGQLFPVYELKVRFVEKLTNAVSEDFVYIPASPQFMKPLAHLINPPLEATSGISVTFTASDPTKTLEQNGLGNFNFMLGYDAVNPDFTIEWYLGDVTEAGANQITACTNKLTCTLKAPAATGDRPEPFTVSLLVRDDASPNASESSDVAQVILNTGTYLPAVTK